MEKTPYIVTVCFGSKCSKRKLKLPKESRFELVGVVAAGIMVDEEIRVVVPIAAMSRDDFLEMSRKLGFDVNHIVALISELKEEVKGERELRFQED